MKAERPKFLFDQKRVLCSFIVLLMVFGFGGGSIGSDLILNSGTTLNFQRLSTVRPDGISAICVENGRDKQVWIPYVQVPEEIKTVLGLNDLIFDQWKNKGGAGDVQFMETFTAKVRLLTYRSEFAGSFRNALEKANLRLARTETIPNQPQPRGTNPADIERMKPPIDSNLVKPDVNGDVVAGETKKLLAMVSEMREVMRKLTDATDAGKGAPTPNTSDPSQIGATSSEIIKSLFVLRNQLDSIEERLRGRNVQAK